MNAITTRKTTAFGVPAIKLSALVAQQASVATPPPGPQPTPVDQATHLRSLMQARARATVIAITSGKGGVGKSNISVNLAVKFAEAGKEVILLDADLGLANADVLCNLDLPFNLSHVIARKKDVREVMYKAPGGFRLIGGASGLARMADLTDADRQRIVSALADLEQSADIILIDTGAGISPNVLSFTRAADNVLVVTTPEPTAITDAYAVVKVVSKDNQPRRVSLLVNQARSASEGRVVYERIATVAKKFLNVSLLDAGHVLSDPEVPSAVRRRVPFVIGAPRSHASHCVSQLAMRLAQGVTVQFDGGGFFNRMSRWFFKG
jgi:flagellar biosynthesis protein FlhG